MICGLIHLLFDYSPKIHDEAIYFKDVIRLGDFLQLVEDVSDLGLVALLREVLH